MRKRQITLYFTVLKNVDGLHNKLLIDGKIITQVNPVKFLGVNLDGGFTWGHHIEYIASKKNGKKHRFYKMSITFFA